jgi:hypothetical protein
MKIALESSQFKITDLLKPQDIKRHLQSKNYIAENNLIKRLAKNTTFSKQPTNTDLIVDNVKSCKIKPKSRSFTRKMSENEIYNIPEIIMDSDVQKDKEIQK